MTYNVSVLQINHFEGWTFAKEYSENLEQLTFERAVFKLRYSNMLDKYCMNNT